MNTTTEQTFKKIQQKALAGGGKEKIERQKKAGKYTAQQRLEILLDPESFEQIDQFVTSPILQNKNYTDGVITGFGKIDGKKVAIFAQDFTLKGGSVGIHHAKKICKIMDMAAKVGCPIIGIIDSGGARIDEGIHGLAGYGEIFLRNTRYSGVIPQISVILGPCAGGAVYSPALTDFILTTDKISQLFITGPNVIKQTLHQEITKEELGGARVHNQLSGVAHFIAQDENDCLQKLKVLLSYLPQNYLSQPHKTLPPHIDPINPESSFAPAHPDGSTSSPHTDVSKDEQKKLEKIVPADPNKSYDVKNIINAIFDKNSFFEIQELFAQNIVIGFAKLDGNVIGIVANQPLIKAGCIDIDTSCKAARFVRFCDSFGTPIISLVDVPGYLPGVGQEHNGIIRHGAKLLYAYAQATVPKITLILRKAYGGAYIVMGSKHLGADINFAWPNAQIAVMGAKGAVSILHSKKLKEIKDLQEKEILQKELEKNYQKDFLNPFTAAEYGYIDSIIEPNQTRNHLIKALEISQDKVEHLPKKKHGNIPL